MRAEIAFLILFPVVLLVAAALTWCLPAHPALLEARAVLLVFGLIQVWALIWSVRD